MMEVVIGLFVLIVVGALAASVSKERAKEEARRKYEDALSRLKEHPTDASRRAFALACGRDYSRLTRNGQGVALFDEVAVMNDINAATAGAVVVAPAAPTAPRTPPAEDRLERLGQLHAKGLISDQEFAEKRQQILDAL